MAKGRGSAFLNIAAIKGAIHVAEEMTLDEIGDAIAGDARRRAPIRKVFKEKKGYRRKYRNLTPTEKALATQRANNYYGHIAPDEFKRRRAVAHIANYARVQIARPSSANTLSRTRELRLLGTETSGRFTSTSGASRLRSGGFEPGPDAAKAMTTRGRYETRTGRAIHMQETTKGTQVRVGGALKASIESDGAVQSGHGMKVTVAARIRYAKFVEFPTVRTASQPFLLPAMQGQRSRLTSVFASNLRKTLGGR